MGINVRLQGEKGDVREEILDPQDILSKLLPRQDGSLLSGVDPYGDTTFNQLQMKQFLSELADVEKQTLNQGQVQMLSSVRKLAEKCSKTVHLYLKFVGD